MKKIHSKVLAVIPARAGSKGVPNKNIRPIAGKPLIAYSIETGLRCPSIDKLVVSTDSKEIAEIARKYDAEVPFLRSSELAKDETPMVPVIKHAVKFLEDQKEQKYDYIVILQPTNPLRTVEDIENCIKKIKKTKADSVISMVKVESHHPVLMKKIENDRVIPYCIEEKEGTNRQDYKPDAYMRSGSVYVVKRDVLMKKNSIWGKEIRPHIVSRKRGIGIDDELDFELVEILLKKKSFP